MLRQIQRLFDGGIAAADDRHRFAAKKNPSQVAQADTPLPRNVSSDGRPRYLAEAPVAMISASQVYSPLSPAQPKRALRQIDRVDMVVDDLGVEALGVPAHALHERRALQVARIARPVVHLGGGHELTALLQAGDEQGFRLARAA